MPNCSGLLRLIVLGTAKAHMSFEAMETIVLEKLQNFVPKVSSFGSRKFKKYVASLGMWNLNRYKNAFHFSKGTDPFYRSA